MTLRAKRFLICLVTMVLGASLTAKDEPKPSALVVSINGSAQVKNRPLQAGEKVALEEWIQTGPNSGVKLLMPDKSIVDIGPSSQFKVQTATLEATDGQLEYGSVRASIQKKLTGKTKFRVRTKSSVLSARGTEFVVDSRPRSGSSSAFIDKVTVKSGIVEMQAPGIENVVLNAGKQVAALIQSTPKGFQVDARSFKPMDVPREALQRTFETATVRDDTFRQVVVIPAGGDRGPNSMGGPTGGSASGSTAPGGDGLKPVLAHIGQDTLAAVQIKAAKDPEVQRPMGPPPAMRDGMLQRPDPNVLNNLNRVGGSLIERKLNEGVNVTVVFQL